VPVLSEWLRLMLGEIARKRDEHERARAEEQQRELENATEDRDAAQARGDQLTPEQELPQQEQATGIEQALSARAARR
jgi:hypothetical protein